MASREQQHWAQDSLQHLHLHFFIIKFSGSHLTGLTARPEMSLYLKQASLAVDSCVQLASTVTQSRVRRISKLMLLYIPLSLGVNSCPLPTSTSCAFSCYLSVTVLNLTNWVQIRCGEKNKTPVCMLPGQLSSFARGRLTVSN